MPIPTTERKADAYFDRIRGAQGPDALASAVAEYVDFVVTEAAAAERAAIRAEFTDRAGGGFFVALLNEILDARNP